MKTAVARLTTAVLLLGSAAFAQSTPNQYLDVLYLHVKPGKGGEFQTMAKKIADANRRYKGSDWITFQTEFGEGGTYMMASSRKDYAAVDLAGKMFMQAMGEAMTPPGAMKLLEDAGSLLLSSRAELRRRRMDLSWNAPSDPDEISRMVGQSRFMRLITIKVRPGRNLDFEDAVRTIKENQEKAEPKLMMLVSESAVGSDAQAFYFSTFRTSLAGFDTQPKPSVREGMGEDAFRKFVGSMAEVEAGVSTALYRIVPELSSPPEPIASADPAFWNPKPAAVRRTPKQAPPAK